MRVDESAFADAHARLDELLPGEGSLAERYQGWRNESAVPRDQIERVVTAVIAEARAWTARLVELPAG